MGNYLSFSGRINRKALWLQYAIPLAIAAFVAAILDNVLHTQFLSPIVSLLTIVPNLAGSVKRCHDRDHSGWFLLVGLIPVIGGLWLCIELGFLRGTEGSNRFGPDPLFGPAGDSRAAFGAY